MKIKKRDLSPNAKLRFPDYLGYFFGAGTNIARYIVSAFLLIYYSNVLYPWSDAGRHGHGCIQML